MSKLKLDSIDHKVFSFFCDMPKNIENFSYYNDHTGTASDLYVSSDRNLLVKTQKNKYNFKSDFFRWLLRDFYKKITFLNLDARRECKGYKIVNQAGLKTPEFYCWGTALSPFNNILSFMVVEFKSDMITGFNYINNLSNNEKYSFIKKLSYEVGALVELGYIHRDLYLNNFLVSPEEKIFWIDVHFRKLSSKKEKESEQIANSLTAHQLGGEAYKK